MFERIGRIVGLPSALLVVLALMMFGAGSATAGPESDVVSNISALALDIQVTPNFVNFGTRPFGSCAYTGPLAAVVTATDCPQGSLNLNAGQGTLTNIGGQARVSVKYKSGRAAGADCGGVVTTSEWAAGASPGADVMTMRAWVSAFSGGTPSVIVFYTIPGNIIPADGSAGTLSVGGVASTPWIMNTGQSAFSDFLLGLPTSSTFTNCTIVTTFVASAS